MNQLERSEKLASQARKGKPENQSKVSQQVLSNLFHELVKGGCNEDLLHESAERLLRNRASSNLEKRKK